MTYIRRNLNNNILNSIVSIPIVRHFWWKSLFLETVPNYSVERYAHAHVHISGPIDFLP